MERKRSYKNVDRKKAIEITLTKYPFSTSIAASKNNK